MTMDAALGIGAMGIICYVSVLLERRDRFRAERDLAERLEELERTTRRIRP